MIIGFLISILSATYTVSTTTTVESGGVVPVGSSAVYARSATSGQKGQMTAGHSTTLTLSGWDGCYIEEIVLTMHSNLRQGAGSLLTCIGDTVVWQIADTDFASVDWNGEFSSEWVNISESIGKKVGNGEDITIYIEASKNSLYIGTYTILYSLPDPVAHEVCFVSGLGDDLACVAEENIGGGVVLPMGKDTMEWRFLGWSEKDVFEAEECPTILRAGERYFPSSDCTLWAVYSDGDVSASASPVSSGTWVIVNTLWCMALSGHVSDDYVATCPVVLDTTDSGVVRLQSAMRPEMAYSIDMEGDSLLRIVHSATGESIGYHGRHLEACDALWRYGVLEDSTYCFYYQDDAMSRMLTFGYGDDALWHEVVGYMMAVDLSVVNSGGLLLFPYFSTTFTSWPLGRYNDVEDVSVTSPHRGKGSYYLPFGNYLLHIYNGEKRLIIR